MSSRTDYQFNSTPPTASPKPAHKISELFGEPRSDDFEENFHNYLRAKATLHDPDQPLDDAHRESLHVAVGHHELLLLATPSKHAHQVLKKFKIVAEIVADEIESGPSASPRVLLALASVQRDLFKHLSDFPQP